MKKHNTHHNLDHHTPIRTMKSRTPEGVDQLRKDSRDEKHRHAHRTQAGKDACGGEDDHAICAIKE